MSENPLEALRDELSGILGGLCGDDGLSLDLVVEDLDDAETRLAELLGKTEATGWASKRFRETVNQLAEAVDRIAELEEQLDQVRSQLSDAEDQIAGLETELAELSK